MVGRGRIGGMVRAMTWPALLLLALGVRGLAQDEDLPPDEVGDIVERYAERGVESLREGNYDEARLRFGKAIRRDPAHKGSRLGLAACHGAVGAYGKARGELEALLASRPGDRDARTMQAEIDLRTGDLLRARETAKAVIAQGGEGPDLAGMRARIVLGESLAREGRRDDARTALDFFPEYYRGRLDALADAAFHAEKLRHEPAKARPLAEEMTLVAKALRLYVELSPLDFAFAGNAIELLGYAQDLDPEGWDAWIEFVRVSRVERERAIARARKALAVAEKKNPELADLYAEAARSILTGFDQSEAKRLAGLALRVNPHHTDARAMLARILLEDNEYAEAETHLDEGLKTDPRHRELLALRATLQLLIGDDAAFEKGMLEVLALDPTYGEGFHLAGLVVASRQRRYDRAVDLVKRGLGIDAQDFQAHASLGIFLANLGRIEEAREALLKSQKMFPFSHPMRENFRTVLDYVIGTMTELRSEHFVYRFDPADEPVLAKFLPGLLEECWEDMVARYGFTPTAPIRVEVFRKADDFSVRTIGLPGIPAIGACFGGLITLDSPRALPEGQFNWASTARHEFAHVMSLQISEGQVPRWFTEGLSVLEEMPLDVGWAKEERYERELFDAWATGTLPKIGTFDAMFRSPRVGYAYYIGGLMLEWLRARSGEAGIVKALRLWGKDRPMEEVFTEAFGLALADFDRLFAEHIRERVGRHRLVPSFGLVSDQLAARAAKDPADGDAMLKLAWAAFQDRRHVDAAMWLDRAQGAGKGEDPLAVLLRAYLSLRAERGDEAVRLLQRFFELGGEDYHGRLNLAAILARRGEAQASAEQLRRAKEAWPWGVSGNNPYALLRAYYKAEGRHDDALAEMEAQARIASKDIPLRYQLAREYVARDRKADAVRVLEEALRITVFNRMIHAALLPLYREGKVWDKAIRAARCIVALPDETDSPEAQADQWLDLAATLLDAGKTEEARQAFAEAKKLSDAESLPRIAEIEKRLGQ